MKKKLAQMVIFSVIALLALALPYVSADTAWKTGVNPKDHPDYICESKEGFCTSATEPCVATCYCRVSPKTCNTWIIADSFYTCLDGGAGGLFGSCKIGDKRAWGRCIGYLTKTCTQYEKFYCASVDVYYGSGCAGGIVCSYQLARPDSCNPKE